MMLVVMLPISLWANTNVAAPVPFQNERMLMIGFSIFLLLVIVVLGRVVNAFAILKKNKIRKSKVDKNTASLMLFIAFMTASFGGFANAEVPAPEKMWIMTIPVDLIVLAVIIFIELVILFVLIKVQMDLIAVPKLKKVESKKWANFFTKINNTVPIEEESSIDLNHDYDGIRELDNNIPKWWLYSFYGTIIIGVIYMYRMFVSETLPDQITELHQANIVAEMKIKEYLSDAANNVDEHSVVMLDESGIQQGMQVYATLGCGTCHGAQGEGNDVGPNLTDDYWLHNGSIKDVFYSIKYGWPEKGMKSWKDDMSPVQIAQVASYIKSLKGSNPPNAKGPQGELYEEAQPSTETENPQ